MDELNFEVTFIDKIENIGSLIEHKEISNDVKSEADWLLKNNFVFKISDSIGGKTKCLKRIVNKKARKSL